MPVKTRAERPQAATTPTPAPQPPQAPVAQQPPAPPPVAAQERPSDAWLGDRVAMIVWLCGALTIAFLMLKDLAYAILFR